MTDTGILNWLERRERISIRRMISKGMGFWIVTVERGGPIIKSTSLREAVEKASSENTND